MKEDRANTILVVDDEAVLRESIAATLTSAGYNVLCAGDATEAAEIWEKSQHGLAVVLCDIFLPGMSGPELAAEFAAQNPKIPIIFISGGSVDAAASLSHLAGRRAFLQKPFTPARLLETVATAARKAA